MARKSSKAVVSLKDVKSDMELITDENEKLKKQLAAVLKENIYLRRRLNQPEDGPIWPNFVNKETVEKINDPDYAYRALDLKGNPMVMDRHTGKWMRLTKAMYIRYHGRVPKDHIVFCLDGDISNTSPDNLAALPKKEFYEQIGMGFDSDGNPTKYEQD